MQVETKRLFLRDFVPEDASDLYEILGDEETMKYCEPAYDLAQTEKFLTDFCIGRHGGVAAVCRDSGKVIGYILFHEGEKGVYEIGWFFNRVYWGRGFAFEACRAVIDYAFCRMGAHKVFAETIDGGRSVRLMEKLGMKREGVQRSQVKNPAGQWADLYLYGMLREEKEGVQGAGMTHE